MLVSVVIPTFNRAKLIAGAIRSALAQAVELEVLVADDGSTDDTANVVAAMGDPRIRWLPGATNQGAGAARNRAIEEARGDWIAFLDSDDTWRPGKLAAQLALTEETGSGVVYTRARRIEGPAEYVLPNSRATVLEGDLSTELLAWNFIPMQSAMVRTDLLRKIGGLDATIRRGQDWDLFLRLAEHTSFAMVDEVLVDAPVQPDSLDHRHDLHVAGMDAILEKHRARYDQAPLAEAELQFRIGIREALHRRAAESRQRLRRAQQLGHGRAGTLLRLTAGHRPLMRLAQWADRRRTGIYNPS